MYNPQAHGAHDVRHAASPHYAEATPAPDSGARSHQYYAEPPPMEDHGPVGRAVTKTLAVVGHAAHNVVRKVAKGVPLSHSTPPEEYSDDQQMVGTSSPMANDDQQQYKSYSQSTDALFAGNYGKLLYEIVEHVEKASCSCTKDQLHVRFYESVVVVEKTEQFLCYPESFVVHTIPKYRLRDIVVSKAQVPKWMFYLGLILFIAGVGVCISAANANKQEGSSSSSSSSGSSNTAGGVICILIGLVFLALPFFLNKYFVQLTLHQPKQALSIWSFLFPRPPLTIVFRTKDKPNDAILMDYCFGPLKAGMGDIHAFSHLLYDDVSSSLHPAGWQDTRLIAANRV